MEMLRLRGGGEARAKKNIILSNRSSMKATALKLLEMSRNACPVLCAVPEQCKVWQCAACNAGSVRRAGKRHGTSRKRAIAVSSWGDLCVGASRNNLGGLSPGPPSSGRARAMPATSMVQAPWKVHHEKCYQRLVRTATVMAAHRPAPHGRKVRCSAAGWR